MKINFASRLRSLRGDVSQTDFACKLGTKQTTYSSWERGIKEPPLNVIIMIARLFGVTSDWLLGLTDNPMTGSGNSNAVASQNSIAIGGHATNSSITTHAVNDYTLIARIADLEQKV